MEKFNPKDLGISSLYVDEIYTYCTYPMVKKMMYLISNYGNVYSLSTHKLLNVYITEKGYNRIILQINKDIDSKHRNQLTLKVHRLVAWEYCKGYSIETNEIDHIDTNRQNNYYKNLEWVSHNENIRRSRQNGNMIDKSTESFIRDICQMFKDGININDVYYAYHQDEDRTMRKKDDKRFYKFLYLILMNKRHVKIRSEYDIDIESVKSSAYINFTQEKILLIHEYIKTGLSNIEIMKKFNYTCKNDNQSFYKRILLERKKFND